MCLLNIFLLLRFKRSYAKKVTMVITNDKNISNLKFRACLVKFFSGFRDIFINYFSLSDFKNKLM